MSVSTDAIIFYGYVWDEETSTPWTIGSDEDEEIDLESDDENDDEDWETRYASKMGLNKTDEDYYDKRRELLAACPCKVDTHCHSDCPMPLVCIKDSYVCNSRGDMTELTQDQFEVEEHWDDELKKFCKLMGIPLPAGGPKWYLVSYWG